MSRKNKVFRAFLHKNPSPTIEETWDAAWANQQDCFQSKRMRELEGTIGLERIDAHKLRERIALLEAERDSCCALNESLMDAAGRHLARIVELEAALDKLARLGNEPNYGNSTGNVIARRALLQEQQE